MFQGMEYVYAVYKEKGFSNAARKLFVSQPSLSTAVKRVEEKVGYPIFDRSVKPLGLTECGKRYIQAVEQIMAAENDFADYINDWGELKTGKLILGGSSLFSSWVLPPLMRQFARRFPHVKLELVEESTGNLEQMLKNGVIDLQIDNCEMDEGMFDRREYQKEYLLLAVPTGFRINDYLEPYQITLKSIKDKSFLREEAATVPLEKFADQPFLMLKPENDTRRRAMNLCEQAGFRPRILFELDQQMTSYNVTCSGMGISFISSTLISRVPENQWVVYYKLAGKESVRTLYFYWRKERYFTPSMKEFLAISEEFKK